MSRVYLVLPHEDLSDGFFFARKCCLTIFARGDCPLNMNFSLANVLDLSAPQERGMAARAATEWMEVATKVTCFVDRGIDKDMRDELERAKLRKLPIEFWRLAGGRPAVEGLHLQDIPHSPDACALCQGPIRWAEIQTEKKI